MKVDGRCHCGFITFAAEIVPEKVWLCHCTDCQTLSGSAFRTVAPTRAGAFTLLSGEVKNYVKIGTSGARRLHGFCPECSSHELEHLAIRNLASFQPGAMPRTAQAVAA